MNPRILGPIGIAMAVMSFTFLGDSVSCYGGHTVAVDTLPPNRLTRILIICL